MAKKQAIKKVVAPTQVFYTDVEGTVRAFNIPQSRTDWSCVDYPKFAFYEDLLLFRIDNFETAWLLATCNWSSDSDFLFSADDRQCLPYIGQGEYNYDDETNKYSDATVDDVYEALKDVFIHTGVVYLVAANTWRQNPDLISPQDADKAVRFDVVHKGQRIIDANTYVYSSKYDAGQNMFYYTDSNRCLHASRVDAIAITKRSGYTPSVTYTMADGAKVEERNMATKEMAQEWINSKV